MYTRLRISNLGKGGRMHMDKFNLRKTDLALGIYLLAAVCFLIIPIPSWMLDIMLAINLGIALMILFNVLYSKEVLNMSSFPTLLLFTTISESPANLARLRARCDLTVLPSNVKFLIALLNLYQSG